MTVVARTSDPLRPFGSPTARCARVRSAVPQIRDDKFSNSLAGFIADLPPSFTCTCRCAAKRMRKCHYGDCRFAAFARGALPGPQPFRENDAVVWDKGRLPFTPRPVGDRCPGEVPQVWAAIWIDTTSDPNPHKTGAGGFVSSVNLYGNKCRIIPNEHASQSRKPLGSIYREARAAAV